MDSFSNDRMTGVARAERDAPQLPLHAKLSLHSDSPAAVTEGSRRGQDLAVAVAVVPRLSAGGRVQPLADGDGVTSSRKSHGGWPVGSWPVWCLIRTAQPGRRPLARAGPDLPDRSGCGSRRAAVAAWRPSRPVRIR